MPAAARIECPNCLGFFEAKPARDGLYHCPDCGYGTWNEQRARETGHNVRGFCLRCDSSTCDLVRKAREQSERLAALVKGKSNGLPEAEASAFAEALEMVTRAVQPLCWKGRCNVLGRLAESIALKQRQEFQKEI